jgi:hypothetical protein
MAIKHHCLYKRANFSKNQPPNTVKTGRLCLKRLGAAENQEKSWFLINKNRQNP